MKKSYISRVADNIIAATTNCNINEAQTLLEKRLLEIGIESIWEDTPYNANTMHLHHEIAKELSEEVMILCKENPKTLEVVANCNLRLQEFNQRFAKTDLADFRVLSRTVVKTKRLV